jgi:drug/metabolite transporter (DMT)-like permease
VAGSSWLWAVFTIIAAAAQTVRNAAQRELTGKLGTVGATQVRFLFGCPFAVVFLLVLLGAGGALPRPTLAFWPWLLDGALTQIAATALMLAAMGERSFVVAIAYIKTEPVQVALFGLLFLGDAVTPMMAAAIGIATAGVIVMSMKPPPPSPPPRPLPNPPPRPLPNPPPQAGEGRVGVTGEGKEGAGRGWRPTLLGLSAGAGFALSAIGFRGAILSLHDPSYAMAATFTVTAGLMVQSALLTLYLALRDRAVLAAILAAWRPSIFAGFMGALASQFWFLAFALATAANVRTLALVEVLFAQAISHFVFRQPLSLREGVGIATIIIGVVVLIWAY